MVSYLTPDSSLLPTVPATQYPGMIMQLSSLPHHSLNTCSELPPCSMPGVASSTIGVLALISVLSNGLIRLKSNKFDSRKVS